MARYLLKAKQMPSTFWGEVVTTAVFLLNWSPTKSLSNITPFEDLPGRKPDVSFLCTFGCVAHVKVTKPNLRKLDDCNVPMVFLEYESGTKVYRLFDPQASCIHVSRDVVFDKKRC